MNLHFSVRKAQMADAAAIAGHNARMALETENKTLDEETVLHGVKAVIKDAHKGFYLVADHHGRVIGQLMITFEWSDWRNRTFWWIQSVYVEPDFRGQGVFSALFRHVRDLARFHKDSAGLRLYVEKTNESARRVYENMGMVQSGYTLYEQEFH